MSEHRHAAKGTAWLRAAASMLGIESGVTPGRLAAVVQGAISALAVQGVGVLVGIVSVPLAVGYIGPERYGAWLTIGSLVGWLAVADLGIGNELTNALSNARAKGDGSERAVVASAFWGLAAVCAVVLAGGAVAWALVDWARMFHVHSSDAAREIGPAVGIALAFFCAGLPCTLTERILITMRRGAIQNAWAIAHSLGSLAAIVATIAMRGGLVALILTTSGVGFAVRLSSTAWLFWKYEPDLRPTWRAFRGDVARRLFGRGTDFFLVQIGALVLYSTDNIVIARILGPGEVTPYAVTWRLFTVPNLIFTAAFPYLWAAYAEALARNDGAWALRTLRASTLFATGIAFAITLPLVLWGREIIRLWAGPAAVPPASVLAWMGVWSAMSAPSACAVCFLNAAGVVRWQVWVGTFTAAINVALSILWARSYGIAGVIAATVVSNVGLGVGPLLAVLARTVRKVRVGGALSKPLLDDPS